MGTILGDGHLETQTKGKTYRLKIEHGLSQKEYVDWLYKQLKTMTVGEPRIKITTIGNKNYQKYWFNSVATDSLRFYAQQFYQENKKVVPKLIHRWLTPLAIAVWFMDDGSKSRSSYYLNTQQFEKNDQLLLMKILARDYSIATTLNRDKHYYRIRIRTSSARRLEIILQPLILPWLHYKLTNDPVTTDPKGEALLIQALIRGQDADSHYKKLKTMA